MIAHFSQETITSQKINHGRKGKLQTQILCTLENDVFPFLGAGRKATILLWPRPYPPTANLLVLAAVCQAELSTELPGPAKE